jgi:hypothetical protein
MQAHARILQHLTADEAPHGRQTTGYGDVVPQTHFGRFGSVVCMLSGPILVSVMTATLSRGMTLNRREELLMKTFDHDHLLADLQEAAAR